MTEELIEPEIRVMSPQSKGYVGAFPPQVEDLIRKVAESPSLHLFSGTSKIGDVRVDLARPEATINADVFNYIKTETRIFKTVFADPPYDIARHGQKLKQYADSRSVGGTVAYQVMLDRFFRAHADNIIWFDYLSPCPKGFHRKKVWLWVSGGFSWFKPRILTWAQRDGARLS